MYQYKSKELEKTDYKTMDYTKWEKKPFNQPIQLTPCYAEPLPISPKKAINIKSLFNYIDQARHKSFIAV